LLNPELTGAAGEHVACSYLIRNGWRSVILNAEAFDIVSVKKDKSLRVQVKSTGQLSKQNSYQWSISTGGRNTKSAIELGACDLIALVALDINKVMFLTVPDLKRQVTMRKKQDVMMAKDLERDTLERALQLISSSAL
jgi:hypothetical protein